MIRRIKSHNLLNGIKFSIAEFAFIALVVAPFAIYYVTHNNILYATISVGIMFNCLTTVAFGLGQFLRKEHDIDLRRVFNKDERERIERENPRLMVDTFIIVVTALLPFVMFIWALYELLLMNKKHN